MDPFALVFYAVICGCLSAFAPPRLARYIRFGIGAAVGIAAASVLPLVQTMLTGGY
ncbi:MAG: hypothetical protein AAFR35_09200 [Pseudomonadota bacterium]